MNTITISRLTTLAGAVALVFGSGAWAADNDLQEFTYQVEQNSQIAMSGDPGNLVIAAPLPGADPVPDSDATTTYAIINNAGTDSKKITAVIDANTPTGVTLSVTLAAPEDTTNGVIGVSEGKKALSTTAVAVVTGVDSGTSSGKTVTYELAATTAAAGMASATDVDVTFTITNP